MIKALNRFSPRRKEAGPLPYVQETDLVAKELFERIDQLRPQTQSPIHNASYVSRELEFLLRDRASNYNRDYPYLDHVIAPLELTSGQPVSVTLEPSHPDSPDVPGFIELKTSSGHTTIFFDTEYRNINVDRRTNDGIALDPGNISITHDRYLQNVLTALSDDLEDGRNRWIASLRKAQADYFIQLVPFGDWGPALVLELINRYRSIFRGDAPNFLLFGMPLEEGTDGEKQPVIKLVTTLPITREVSDELAYTWALPLPQGATADHIKHYWGGSMTRKTYQEENHGITITVDTLAPEMENFNMVSSDTVTKLRDRTALERHFAESLRGGVPVFFPHLPVEAQPTLLLVRPDKSPGGDYYFEL